MKSLAKVIEFPVPEKRKACPEGPKDDDGIMVGKGLTDDAMRQLFERFSNPQYEKDYRNRALLYLMSKTALRASEVVNLRWSDLLEDNTGIKVFKYKKKGGKIGFVVPGEDAIHAMREYHNIVHIKSDVIFLSMPNNTNRHNRRQLTSRGLQKIINQWGLRTCNDRLIHPHAIRHTSIQKALDEAGSIAAQKLAQHSTPVTTSRFYTKPYHDCSDLLTWDEKCNTKKTEGGDDMKLE